MDKKKILSDAAQAVSEKKPGFPVRVLRCVKRRLAAFWRWLRGLDKLLFFNILLLLLVCMFSFVMLDQVRKGRSAPVMRAASEGMGYTLTERVQVFDLTQQVARPNRPIIVMARSNDTVVATKIASAPRQRARQAAPQPVVLPIRQHQANRPATIPTVRTRLPGNTIIDGRHTQNARIQSMTMVDGNLILQNLRTYTLPCGVRIDGNLLLRNVNQLRFCVSDQPGVPSFSIRGNIYVSSNSSFGPIPKNAHLGGQVIF